MEDEEGGSSPFWLQTADTLYLRRRSFRRSSSSACLNSGVFIVLLLVVALCFIFVVIPSFLSFTSQIFRPHSVKKSWDSVNLVLVLFAIICGFLSRNSNENRVDFNEDRTALRSSEQGRKSEPSTPQKWYDYSDRSAYNSISRLRSSSSYPDLRQEPPWIASDDRWRFYDDTHVSSYRFSSSDRIHHSQPRLEIEEAEEDLLAKNVAPATPEVRQEEELNSAPPPSSPPPSPPAQPPILPSPPPTPPSNVLINRPKRTYEAVAHRSADFEADSFQPLSPDPPPVVTESEQKIGRSEEKRSGSTKVFLTSLRRRKKKQRQKSVENFETLIGSQRPCVSFSIPPPSPPPPPPPPPPTSAFYNIFSSKKRKQKKIQSVPTPPPPPPRFAYSARQIKTKALTQSLKVNKPPIPARLSSFSDREDNVSVGKDSPLHPIPPPPPPPPPFKMPEWKFVVQGDYVRIKSNSSSPRDSPDLDDSEGSPSKKVATEFVESTKTMFCPSPDVNTKADSFIARFRAGLKLEKMNSIKGTQEREKSNLGREPSPGL